MKLGLKAAFSAGLLKKNGYSEKGYRKFVPQFRTFCGRITILSHVADIVWGNIQSFEKIVEINSCTFVYGKV